MKKKKLAFAAALALALALRAMAPWSASAQAAQPQGAVDASRGMDVVVLLDSSQSVLPYYQDVTDYLLTSVVRDYLRFGDTFHLISFGDSAQTEIAQRMNDERDVKSVLGRLYLLYPLASRTDFLGALDYLRQYLDDLSETRRKVVIIVTDGMHNPPSGGASASLDPALAASRIESIGADIRSKGWELRLVKLPFAPAEGAPAAAGEADRQGAAASSGLPAAASSTKGDPKSASTAAGASGSSPRQGEPGGSSYFDLAAKALGAPVAEFDSGDKESLARRSLSLPAVTYPDHLGKRGYRFSFPLQVRNGSGTDIGLELEQLLLDGRDMLAEKAFLSLGASKSGTLAVRVELPAEMEPGEMSLAVEPRFANGLRVDPPAGLLRFTLRRMPLSGLFQSGARIALFAILVALGSALALALVLLIRRMSKRAEAPVVAAVLDSATPRSPSGQRLAASARPDAAIGGGARSAAAAGTATASASGQATAAAAKAAAPSATYAGAAALPSSAATYAGAAPLPSAHTTYAGAAPLPSAHATYVGAAGLPAAAAAGSAPYGIPPAKRDEHEAEIEREAAAMAQAARDEAARSASLLSDASSNRSLAAAKELIESYKAARDAARKAARASGAAAQADPGIRVVKPGTMRVELRVENQNPNVGSRNIRTMRAGTSRSVGGGGSDFLVFLMPAARRAAELRFDGETFTFVPLKPELFPGSEGAIEDCIGQDILMLGKNGYPLILRFERYRQPLDSINRLLRCIETPGLFEAVDAGT